MLVIYTQKRPYLLLNWTGEYDRHGFKSFLLQFVNGTKVVDKLSVISGSPAAQYRPLIHPSKDFSGSGNPIPEGIYKIGGIIRMKAPEPGVGYTKIPLDVLSDFRANNRGEFLYHSDFNAKVAPGSLGCIVTYNEKDMDRIISWCSQKTRPLVTVVDYRLGLLANKGVNVFAA